MERNIRCITESFSMQPTTRFVGGSGCVVIKLEDIQISADKFPYYCGYNQDGEKLFEYKQGTVNVDYFTNKEYEAFKNRSF